MIQSLQPSLSPLSLTSSSVGGVGPSSGFVSKEELTDAGVVVTRLQSESLFNLKNCSNIVRTGRFADNHFSLFCCLWI